MCPICGTKFRPMGRQRYDKPACAAKAYRRRQKTTTPALMPCKQCAKPFPPVRSNQSYCGRKCAKAADNSRQQAVKRSEEAAREILRQREAGELMEADFKAAAANLGITRDATSIGRRPTPAEKMIQQALYDAEATRRAQIPRREPCGFDPLAEFAYDPHFLRREQAIEEHLRTKDWEGQGPSIGAMQALGSSDDEKGT